MADIQYLTLDSGHLQPETKTILSGLRSKLKIKELTIKTSQTSYLLLALHKTMLNQLLELIAMVILNLPQLLPLLLQFN